MTRFLGRRGDTHMPPPPRGETFGWDLVTRRGLNVSPAGNFAPPLRTAGWGVPAHSGSGRAVGGPPGDSCDLTTVDFLTQLTKAQFRSPMAATKQTCHAVHPPRRTVHSTGAHPAHPARTGNPATGLRGSAFGKPHMSARAAGEDRAPRKTVWSALVPQARTHSKEETLMSNPKPVPNDQRADVKNPNNPAHGADQANRDAQQKRTPSSGEQSPKK